MTGAVLAARLNRPCTLVLRVEGPADVYGDPTWVESTQASRCYAEQVVASEPGDPHYQADDYRFVLDSDCPLTGVEAVELDGKRFEVIGPPWPAWDPRTATVHHVELRARAAP